MTSLGLRTDYIQGHERGKARMAQGSPSEAPHQTLASHEDPGRRNVSRGSDGEPQVSDSPTTWEYAGGSVERDEATSRDRSE